MKITFILPGRGRSGGVKCTVTAANGLMRRGHKVRLLVFKGQFMTRLRDFYLGLRYPGRTDWTELFGGKTELCSDINTRIFENGEIVVAAGGWAAKEIAKITNPNIKKVHYVHGVDLPDPEKLRDIWSERAPKIIVSSYLEKVIRDVCGQEVSAVIPNGIDPDEYYSSVPEAERDGIGTIYGQGYHKDPQTIIAVLNSAREKWPNLPIRVFGACRRPLELRNVEYTRLPSLNVARKIYSRSLVWFLGSRSEGFPAPLLEAMCCGCAVVSTHCGGGAIDIIKHEENGLLVEDRNVKGLVDGIGMLLERPESRSRFVAKSRETVHEFTWEKSIDKFECALLSICNQA